MKVLTQYVKNGEIMKVFDGVSMVTWRSDGRPELHLRSGAKFTLETGLYRIISVS